MRRHAPIFLLLLAAATSAGAVERRYSLTDFDRILVEGPYQVRLTTGLSTSGRATGSQRALDRVLVEVQGSTLRIRPNRSSWGGYPGQPQDPAPTILVTTRSLRTAAVNGPGNLSVDKVRGLRLDLSLAGSGRIAIGSLDVDNLALTSLGAGQIALGGHAKQAKMLLQGSVSLDGRALRADDAQLTAESAGTITFAATRSAKVRATGAGDVTVTGNAACTVEALGTGTVRCGK